MKAFYSRFMKEYIRAAGWRALLVLAVIVLTLGMMIPSGKGTAEAAQTLTPVNFLVWINNQPVQEGMEVQEGDHVTLTFNWRIPNNLQAGTYTYALGITPNIALNEDSTEGELWFRDAQGTEVNLAKYQFTIENDVLRIEMHTGEIEDIEKYSNIAGGITMEGKVQYSADKSEKDGSTHPLGFGSTRPEVVYVNKGEVTMEKTRDGKGMSEGRFYIDYKVTASVREITKNLSLTDLIDEKMEIDLSSVQVTDGDGNAVSVNVSPNGNGFTLKLPDGVNKADTEKYTITYRALVKSDVELEDVSSAGSIKNTASLTYTDDHDEEQKIEKTVSSNFTKPSITKTGTVLYTDAGDNNYVPVRKDGRYLSTSTQLKLYPVKYTITLNMGDMGETVPGASVDLTDKMMQTFGSMTEEEWDQWMFHNPSGPNAVLAYYAWKDLPDALRTFFSDLKDIYGTTVPDFSSLVDEKGTRLFSTDADLIKALAHTHTLFDMGENPGVTAHVDQPLTLADFDHQAGTSVYTYDYIVMVPSTDLYSDTFENAIEGTVDTVPVKTKTTTFFQVSPGPILVKGPDGLPFNSNYAYDTNEKTTGPSTQHVYQYEKELAEGESITSVTYFVALDMEALMYVHDAEGKTTNRTIQDFQKTLNEISHIKLMDIVGGGAYKIYQNGATNTIQTTSMGNTLDLGTITDIRLNLYHKTSHTVSFSPVGSSNTQYDEFAAAEDALLTYANTYGWADDQKEGWDQTTFYSLYSAYRIKAMAYFQSTGYLGSVAQADMPAGSSITIQGNKITADIDAGSLSALQFKQEVYNPDGSVTSASSSSPLRSVYTMVTQNYVLALSYTVNLSDSALKSLANGTNVTAYNGAIVYFGLDENPDDDPVQPDWVNTQYTIKPVEPDEKEPSLTVNKSAVDSLTLSDGSTCTYTEGIQYRGWKLQAKLSDFTVKDSPQQIVIVDTLSDNQEWSELTKGGGIIAYASSQGNTSATVNATSSVRLSADLYSAVIKEDGTLVITVPYTSALVDAMSGLSGSTRYLNFYVQSRVKDSALITESPTKVSLKNTIAPGPDGVSFSPTTATVNITTEELINKSIMDSTYSVVSEKPEWDEKGLELYAYYAIEFNKLGLDVNPDGNTVDIQDVLSNTEIMMLDGESVKAIDPETGTEVDIGWTQDGNVITFTLPDQKHLIVRYRVRLNLPEHGNPEWKLVTNSGNGVQIEVDEDTTIGGKPTDFAQVEMEVTAWIRAENGQLTIWKYAMENLEGEETRFPLADAVFTITSIYTNLGSDDTLIKTVTVPEDGFVTTELPLSRVYELKEVSSPAGYRTDEGNALYFLLPAEDSVDTSAVATGGKPIHVIVTLEQLLGLREKDAELASRTTAEVFALLGAEGGNLKLFVLTDEETGKAALTEAGLSNILAMDPIWSIQPGAMAYRNSNVSTLLKASKDFRAEGEFQGSPSETFSFLLQTSGENPAPVYVREEDGYSEFTEMTITTGEMGIGNTEALEIPRLYFAEPGVYAFTLREIIPESGVKGVQYDTSEYTIQVSIKAEDFPSALSAADENGEITEVTYTGGTSETLAEFVNTYSEEAEKEEEKREEKEEEKKEEEKQEEKADEKQEDEKQEEKQEEKEDEKQEDEKQKEEKEEETKPDVPEQPEDVGYDFKFTFTKQWEGGTEDSIDFVLYNPDGTVRHKKFKKKIISDTEWRYEAWFEYGEDFYVIETPPGGYRVRYENIGAHAGETDRCYDGGKIINYTVPKTGDDAHLLLWMACVLTGLGGLTAMLLARQGKRRG